MGIDVYKRQVRRQGGENCWLGWRQANWGTRWNTLKAQASAAAYDGGDTILFYTQDAGCLLYTSSG